MIQVSEAEDEEEEEEVDVPLRAYWHARNAGSSGSGIGKAPDADNARELAAKQGALGGQPGGCQHQ